MSGKCRRRLCLSECRVSSYRFWVFYSYFPKISKDAMVNITTLRVTWGGYRVWRSQIEMVAMSRLRLTAWPGSVSTESLLSF